MALLPLDIVRTNIASPALYPQRLDLGRQALLFTRMSENDYRAASFLDDRILTPASEGRWVKFNEMAPWIETLAPTLPLHFIFHAGHVGSTLVSRMLDDVGGVLPLREPHPLRTLAELHDANSPDAARLAPWLLALWRRGFADTRAVVLKATSSAARIHDALLGALPQSRALYLNLGAEPYLAALLAGENTPLDLQGHAPERRRRLAALGVDLLTEPATSLGEAAAMAWAAEKLTQKRAEAAFPDRVLSIDFDRFLADPGSALGQICAHFRLQAPEDYISGAARHGALTRYSKAPEHAFTPTIRAQILADSRARNAAEIAKGLRWLETHARSAPALAAALSA